MGEERWDRLFRELEAAAEPQIDDDEVADLARAEQVSVQLAARLVGSLGRSLQLRTRSGELRSGVLHQVAASWIVLREPAAAHLIPISAIAGIAELGRPKPGVIDLPLGVILRRIAQHGGDIIIDAGPVVRGRLLRVAADHVDVVPESSAIWSVPLRAIESVRFPSAVLDQLT